MAHALLTTPFGATTTASEVVSGLDLAGKHAIVTGASSGIGVETARALAAAGAEITLAVRNVEAGTATAADIATSTGRAAPSVRPLDVADQESVAAFAAGWDRSLDILVANAAVMALPRLERTREGWELQLATNHLGHFALAVGLHDALRAAGSARIVVVSSVGHIDGDVDLDDLMFERRPYNEWAAYGQSKTAGILFAVEATRRWGADGITANALNPGRIPTTALMRHLEPVAGEARASANATGVSVKTVEQGAATSVLLATYLGLDGIGGRYFEDCNEAGPLVAGVRRGVAPYALDPVAAERLWTVSSDLIEGA